MKTEWNLGLLYDSARDPKIEKDVRAYERACAIFEKKYKSKNSWLRSDSKLLSALIDFEKLYAMPESVRALRYLHYRKDLNSADQEAESLANKISDQITKAGNKIVFFELALGKIGKKLQQKFLRSKTLQQYRYYLYRTFLIARYTLTEPEEKILNLKSLPSHGLWTQGQEKLLNQQTVKYKSKDIPISEAQNLLRQLPTDERQRLSDDINHVLKNISHFAESEINAVYINKKVNDELRGFTEPYSATILGYQNDEKSIITFVETVTKHFKIAHKFFKIKAKLLNLDRLEYADRAAVIGKLKLAPSFEESVKIFKQALTKVDQKYIEILDSYLKNGQIDVSPRKGKRGGAYCAGELNMPTFVLLNHVDSMDALKTFAHEMGHAFHTELSKSQPPLYQSYTISAAEVASTLFENFAFDEVFETLTKEEKIVALHDKIGDGVATIFRQIACFNYELELHRGVREKGALSKEEMAALHNKHMQAYLGPMFDMKENDGYFFVSWPHLRYFFYVYSYAYGEIISMALYERYKKDRSYMKEIEKFLSAGGSMSPEHIFKSIGIDTTKPSFFLEGLKKIGKDIDRLEKLTNSQKMP